MLAGNVGNLGLLATLFAVNGISSTDRQRGYFRFLFSKPASVPRFYAQDFALRLAGVVAVALVLFAAFASLTGSALAGWAVGHVAITFLLVGGVGFLLSALTHHDGIALVLVYVGTALLRAGGVVAAAVLPGWAGRALWWLSNALPPFHLLDALRDALAAGTPPRAGDLVWVLSYGAGCFAAGLLVLRQRPLST